MSAGAASATGLIRLLRPRRSTLYRQIIAWFFIPTAIILVAVAVVNFFAYQDVTGDLVIEKDKDLTRLSAGQFASSLSEYTDLLESISREVMAGGLNPNSPDLSLARFANRLTIFDGGVILLNTSGAVTAEHPESLQLFGEDWSGREIFRELVRSRTAVFSDIVPGSEGEPVIAVAVPMIDSAGQLQGSMVGMFSLGETAVSTFYGGIVRLRLARGGTAYIVDGNGGIIYHSDPERIGEDISSQPVVRQVLSGASSAERTQSEDGEAIVASFAPVPGTSWGLITQESWASLTAEGSGHQRFLMSLLIAGIVAPALIVTIGLKRVMRPIEDLNHAAQDVARGNYGRQVAVRSTDEIGELASEFNKMSRELESSYSPLEQRIRERTEELRWSELRYSSLFEQSMDAIFITAADGHVVDANQAALDLFGLTKSEAIGSQISDRIADPAERERLGLALDEGHGGVRDFEIRLIKKDDSIIDCLLTARRRSDGRSGEPDGVEGVIRDITERKRTEEELFQQTRETAVLDERNRMAREIHDTLAQGFTGIVLQLEAGEEALGDMQTEASAHIKRAKDLARESLREARTSVWNLTPNVLQGSTLAEALDAEVRRFDARGSERASFSLKGNEQYLDAGKQTALLRICQEALINARKYARAGNIQVGLEFTEDSVRLTVQDDGVGFDTQNTRPRDGTDGGGFGLTSMRQRAQLEGGSFTVSSSRGTGTTIEAVVPVEVSSSSRGKH